MAFDPSKLGAPITQTKTGGFDPSKLGAPIEQPKTNLFAEKTFQTKTSTTPTASLIKNDFASRTFNNPPPTVPDRANLVSKIAPTAGMIGGGFLGGIVGGVPGAIAGSGVGAAAGEALSEKLKGEQLQPSKIATEGAIGVGTELIGGPLVKAGANLLKATGKTISETVLPTSLKEAGLIQTYKANNSLFNRLVSVFDTATSKAPSTAASTAFEKGIAGTESMIGVQSKKVATDLWQKFIGPKLAFSKIKINMPTFFKEAEQKIISETPEISLQKELLNALESMKEDYAGIGEITLPKLQEFKEGWARLVPEKAYRGKPIAGAFNDMKDTLSDMARTKIYDTLGPEIKKAYIDYGNLKALQELGQKAMTGGKLKGGAGSFMSAIKDMALTPIGTVGGQTIYKVGEGIELVGDPGARFIRDLFAPTPEQIIGK